MNLNEPISPDRTQYDIRQVLKSRQKIGSFRLYPGTKLWEMVCVSNAGESVPGLNAVNGDFDPDLAIVREATFKVVTVDAIEPTIAVDLGPKIIELGQVKRGVKRTFDICDGNLYDVAMNAETARRKIIKKHFEPFK